MDKPPILNNYISSNYSFPINFQYPHSFAVSQVQFGLVMAYASGNKIIVLINCQLVSAVLTGHDVDVCTVAFETGGQHIISCDIGGLVNFWVFQDATWQNTRHVCLPLIAVCMGWFPPRRYFAYSTEKGLYLSTSLEDIHAHAELIAEKSSFCLFNHDASLLASHDYGRLLTMFLFSAKPYLTQVIKHPEPIFSFDYHPSLSMFFTISKTGILRIFRLSSLCTFSCTSVIATTCTCSFLREPMIPAVKLHSTPSKTSTLVFVSQDNETKIVSVREDGRFEDAHHLNFPRIPFQGSRFMNVFKTNQGVRVVQVNNNEIQTFIASPMGDISEGKMEKKLAFSIHKDPIIKSEFAPQSDSLFTLDSNGLLICWAIFSIYTNESSVSDHCQNASWLNSDTIAYSEDKKIFSYDVSSHQSKELVEYSSILENSSNDSFTFFSNNNILFLLTYNSLFYNNEHHQLSKPVTLNYSLSKFSNDSSILIVQNQDLTLTTYLLPTFEEIPVKQNSQFKSKIIISAMSLTEFVIMNENHDLLEIYSYSYKNIEFELRDSIKIPKMNGLYTDSSIIGGRILLFDDSGIFSLSNNFTRIYSGKLTSIATNDVGHIAIIVGPTFNVFPSWCFPYYEPKVISYDDEIAIDAYKKRHQKHPNHYTVVSKVTKPVQKDPEVILDHQIMVSPYLAIIPNNNQKSQIKNTFAHLFEFEAINNLDNPIPEQVPAIPNQEPIRTHFKLDIPEFKVVFDIINILPNCFDLYGLRYLEAIEECNWPPSYIALFLSLSRSQSQIADYLIDFSKKPHIHIQNPDSGEMQKKFLISNLSKFYLPVAIEQNEVLRKVVKEALSNQWAENHNPDSLALLHIAMGETLKLSRFYTIAGDNGKADFFARNFTIEKNRKVALKNAYSALKKTNYDIASALFLLANDLSTCLNIVSTKLNDPILAFLVLRFLHPNYNSPEMKSFLSTVNWNDNIIPILISRLIHLQQNTIDSSASEIAQKLEDIILNDPKTKTEFGDRRIPLYQIYAHISRNHSIANDLVSKLCLDGFSPLASYLLKLIECPFDKVRSLDISETDINTSNTKQESSDNEEEDEYLDLSHRGKGAFDFNFGMKSGRYDEGDEYDEEEDKPKVEKMKEFNFGGYDDNMDDDNWDSDSDSDSSQNDDVKPEDESQESGISKEAERLKEEKEEEAKRLKQERDDRISSIFISFEKTAVSAYNTFFRSTPTENLNSTPSSELDIAGQFAVKFSFHHIGFPLLESNKKYISMKLLSSFLDFCSLSFFQSAAFPSTPKQLLLLATLLFRESLFSSSSISLSSFLSSLDHGQSQDDIIDFSRPSTYESHTTSSDPDRKSDTLCLQAIIDHKNNGYMHSVFSACLAISFWTYNIEFLYQMLWKSPSPFYFSPSSLSIDHGLFDVDLTSPRFPDAIPLLLTRYSRNTSIQVVTLERDRLLIVFLLFDRILEIAPHFGSTGSLPNQSLSFDHEWQTMILHRYWTMSRSLLYFQTALDCEPLQSPSIDPSEQLDPLSSAIIRQHLNSQLKLNKINDDALQRLPYPPVYRLALLRDRPEQLQVPIESHIDGTEISIISIALNPNVPGEMVILTERQIMSIKTDVHELKLIEENTNEAFALVPHPSFGLFLALTPSAVLLYDFWHGSTGLAFGLTCTRERITTAALSKNGTKIAVCGSSTIDIYQFDVAHTATDPVTTRSVRGVIAAAVWINDETTLAIGGGCHDKTNPADETFLTIVNTLTKYNTPVQVKPGLGPITAMEIELPRGLLVFSTINGFVVICNARKSFEPVAYLNLKARITCMASVFEFFVVGTENSVVGFKTSKPQTFDDNRSPFQIRCIAASQSIVVIAGQSNTILIWKAH